MYLFFAYFYIIMVVIKAILFIGAEAYASLRSEEDLNVSGDEYHFGFANSADSDKLLVTDLGLDYSTSIKLGSTERVTFNVVYG